jgi:hypothetical protein
MRKDVTGHVLLTGGIVTSYDPKAIDWEKIDALRSIGLSPWYG